MKEQIKEIIAEVVGIDVNSIGDDALIVDDLGADSIAIMEIVMELESKFSREVNTADIPNLKSVNNIIQYLEGK